jgi:hypothetical protein
VKPAASSGEPPQADGGSSAPAATTVSQAPSGDESTAEPPLPPSRKVIEAQPSRKAVEAQPPKPSKLADTAEHKSAKPARAAAKPVNANVADRAPAPPQAAEPPPSGLASVLHNVFGGAHDAPSTSVAASSASSRLSQGLGDSDPGLRAGARWGETSPVGTTTIARTAAAAPVTIKLASSVSEQSANETLSRLQKQFPGLLASGAVRREDMGKFGVFYRVRVGPLSRETADKVCAQLKAGGASCSMSGG